MKKIITLILVAIMCLSLVACGSNEDNINDALQGSWVASWTAMGQNISRYYTFKGNTYTTGGVAILGELDTKTGTFEIKDSTIKLIPDDGSESSELDFTYNEKTGELTLWWNDDVQLEKGKVNVKY